MAEAPLTAQSFLFQRRPGLKGNPGLQGMVTEGDPSSIPPTAFQLLRNFRFLGKTLYTRPGHTFYGNAGGEVYLLTSFPVVNPRTRLWITVLGCFGETIGTGARIIHYDPDENPTFQVYANYFAEGSRQNPMAVYGDDLYIGDKSLLRKPVIVSTPPGVAVQDVLESPPDAPIFDFGPTYTITWMKEFDGKLFMGVSDGGITCKICYWDGLSIREDLVGSALSPVRPSFAAEVFRGTKLVVGFDATAGHVRVRSLGATPGTWTTVALAGYSTGIGGNSMKEHRDFVAIAGGNRDLFKYHEPAGVPTLVVLRNIATADNTGNGITAVANHRGLLYYLWNGASPGYASKVGQYNADNPGTPVEFVDSFLDISGGIANFKGGFALESYREFLYACGAAQWLISFSTDEVTGVGSATVINDGGAPGLGINFPGLQLMVH